MRRNRASRRGGCRGRRRLATHSATNGRNTVLTLLLFHQLWNFVEWSPLKHGAFGGGSVRYFLMCGQNRLSGKALAASIVAAFVRSFAGMNTSMCNCVNNRYDMLINQLILPMTS